MLRFGPYRLDLLDERLWKEDEHVPLGRKAFAVLAHLASDAGRLVTKDDLLNAVWPTIAVSEAVLTTAMRSIRQAIGDARHPPRFVQTVYGRGYRFIAPVIATIDADGVDGAGDDGRAAHESETTAALVGRDVEVARLQEWFAAMARGTRRIGFVIGEAGVGKTTLVDSFLRQLAASGAASVGRGQCIEQYGAGEAYLPILEALTQLLRDHELPVARAIRRHAPSWLLHLPSAAAPAGPQRPVAAQRMLRELTDAFDVMTTTAPVVLVLEDLQWSDRSTLAWLAHVGRRREPARLLVLGTYRATDGLLATGPLGDAMAELRHQPQSGELRLDYLSKDAVRTYLKRRCSRAPSEEMVDTIHRRSGGHPLFLASLVDDMLAVSVKGVADPEHGADPAAGTIPLRVRHFLDHRIEQLSDDDRTLLEAASVVGDRFSVAAVAAITTVAVDHVEARCAAWTRTHHLLVPDGMAAWPDSTLAARYRFRHELVHEATYARISPERRAQLHHRLGCRLERAYGRRAQAIAAELGSHFERGRDVRKAAVYLEQAARNAIQRSAYVEADRHLRTVADLLVYWPPDRRRRQLESRLALLVAQSQEATRGWAAAEVAEAFEKARALSVTLRDDTRWLQATWGLIAASIVRADLHRTRALAYQLRDRARRREDPLFTMAAHVELGGTAMALGRTAIAGRHFRRAEQLYDARHRRASIAAFGMDMGVFARVWSSHLLWLEGSADRAHVRALAAVADATKAEHPFTQTVALAYAAMLCQFRGDVAAVDRLAQDTIAHATAHGFGYYLAWAQVLQGWSRTAQGDAERALPSMAEAVERLGAMAGFRLPYYRSLLAESCARAGHVEQAQTLIAEAFGDVRRTGERWWEPELHRQQGALLVAAGRRDEATRSFQTAMATAGKQRARSLELRAALSLARASHHWEDWPAACAALRRACGQWPEESSTPDLDDARALVSASPEEPPSRIPAGVHLRTHDTITALARGRTSFGGRAWAEAYDALAVADTASPLDPADLVRLATAAYLTGRDAECEAAWTRAHARFLRDRDIEAAARCAFWLAFLLHHRGELARGGGWLARARRVLDGLGCESVVEGYLHIPAAVRCVVTGQAADGHDLFARAVDIARRFNDPDLMTMALQGQGRASIRLDKLPEGFALLDEAMVAVTAGETSAMIAGDTYCSVIEACRETFDLVRAREWTGAMSAWLASEPDVVAYRGDCLWHRAELLQREGNWTLAMEEASNACTRLAQPPGQRAIGAAHYQRAELYRLTGEHAKAERAYREAELAGCSPQPGVSLLRLDRGQIDEAAAAIRQATDALRGRSARCRLLPAYVDIMLAAGDPDEAQKGSGELSESARAFASPMLVAEAHYASGAILLATGVFAEGVAELRHAGAAFAALALPYESARARLLIAVAFRRLRDMRAARREAQEARSTFERLGASTELTRIDELMQSDDGTAADALSQREVEVLRLLATGTTNRAIAVTLGVSEKTVARHISNILTKLDLPNRTAAAAYAHQRGLV
jgi:DNA-binding winged helix-turn-helix (wHTH) protein/DNA-binding CsgD family transcriptional regulator/predicted ATPase